MDYQFLTVWHHLVDLIQWLSQATKISLWVPINLLILTKYIVMTISTLSVVQALATLFALSLLNLIRFQIHILLHLEYSQILQFHQDQSF